MELHDAFSELDLAGDASLAQAKAKYRALAMKWHPDRNPGAVAEARMKALNVAYAVVVEHLKSVDHAAPPIRPQAKPRPANRPRSPNSHRSHDQSLHRTVEISLLDAMRGCSRRLSGQLSHPCAACRGSGQAPGTNADNQCSTCIGAGYYAERGPDGTRGRVVRCKACEGVGRLVRPCKACKGLGGIEGKVWRQTLKIPPGVRSGTVLRIPIQTDDGNGRQHAVELTVTVHVRRHHLFSQSDLDLSVVIPVSIWRWYAGGELLAPTPTGAVRVQMHPMCDRITMAGQGMPDPNNTHIRGALYFLPRPVTPDEVSDEQRELLEKLEALTAIPQIEKWALDLADWRDASDDARYPREGLG